MTTESPKESQESPNTPRAGEIIVGVIALALGTIVIYTAIGIFAIAGLFGVRRKPVVR